MAKWECALSFDGTGSLPRLPFVPFAVLRESCEVHCMSNTPWWVADSHRQTRRQCQQIGDGCISMGKNKAMVNTVGQGIKSRDRHEQRTAWWGAEFTIPGWSALKVWQLCSGFSSWNNNSYGSDGEADKIYDSRVQALKRNLSCPTVTL